MKKTLIKNKWFIDKESEYRNIYHGVLDHILSRKTRFQQVDIIDTKLFGRMVILDNKIQSSEKDEFIYHEAIVHPALITHPKPRNILILGGGEGATLREVLKHPSVNKVVMVDIDREFVHLCKTHLKKWHKGSFFDKRVEILFIDAMQYIKNTEYKFDIIITDISDPITDGPALMIYTKDFYSLIKKVLMPDGIFVTHATEVKYFASTHNAEKIFKILADIFPKTSLYFEYIPSYATLWSFVVSSSKYDIKTTTASLIKKRLKERKLKALRFYDSETHKRMFVLPRCLKENFFHCEFIQTLF
jgi:spermidine synthase